MKNALRYAGLLTASLTGLVVGSFALAQVSPSVDGIVTLTPNFMATVMANVGVLFNDVAPVVLIVAAIPFAFYVIRRVIGLVRAV